MSHSNHPRRHHHVWQIVAVERRGGLAIGKPKAQVYFCTVNGCHATKRVPVGSKP